MRVTKRTIKRRGRGGKKRARTSRKTRRKSSKGGGWFSSNKVENNLEVNEFARILSGLSQSAENGKTAAENTISKWTPDKQERFTQWKEQPQEE
jgi:hypothetical protein